MRLRRTSSTDRITMASQEYRELMMEAVKEMGLKRISMIKQVLFFHTQMEVFLEMLHKRTLMEHLKAKLEKALISMLWTENRQHLEVFQSFRSKEASKTLLTSQMLHSIKIVKSRNLWVLT